MTIKENYEALKAQPSDINEHLETLYGFALNCEHITEMGVRGVVSTWAFLNAKPKKLVCYDLEKSPNVDVAISRAEAEGLKMVFYEADVLKADIEHTDFLFIDTFHTCTQLKAELERHAGKANKYIGFHDTTSFEWVGEEPYDGSGIKDKGLRYALVPFLEANPEWQIVYHTNKNNGLTIIGK